MTDFDAPDPRHTPGRSSSRPGLWRVLSLLLVIAAVVVVAMWMLQSRSTRDIAAPNGHTLELRSTDVVVDSLDLPPNATVAVLGFDHREATPLGPGGARLDIPTIVPVMVALLDDQGDIHGLRLVSRPVDRERVVITPASTAHALLVLSPAFLDADLERARQQVEFIDDDPAYETVVEAIAASSNLGSANDAVETAIAAILDRVHRANPLSDQGCDSILNPAARAVAGTCAVPNSTGSTINNEQDRWVLAFASPQPYEVLCAAVAPAGTPGSQRTIGRVECGDRVLLAAPGPIVDRSSERAAEIDRIRLATTVQVFGAFAAPIVDLAGGSAGLNRSTNAHVLDHIEPLVDRMTDRIRNDPGLAGALDVVISSATPPERHGATVDAARALLDEPAAYIEDWNADASTHLQFLDLFERIGDRMQVVGRSEWRWTADAVGIAELGEDR